MGGSLDGAEPIALRLISRAVMWLHIPVWRVGNMILRRRRSINFGGFEQPCVKMNIFISNWVFCSANELQIVLISLWAGL